MTPARHVFFAALNLGLPWTAAAAPAKIDFNFDIQPLISAKCFHCHGPDEKARKAKLRLDVREDALKEHDGVKAIVPGHPEESELVARILTGDEDEIMPPPKEGHALEQREIDLLKRWIAEGAEYKPHWAFMPPRLPAVPSGATHPVDAFIFERLAREGLALSPEAERPLLGRRVSLDLTGLPPTPEQLAAFVHDPAPDAYEKFVDRLLAAPAYGERWAKMWLDLARYADSTGYGSDKFRLTIWPYRDWVIDAFNANLPYDRFSIEQLAGDLLPNATPQQIAATAFHRNTMTNVEGGTDDEEYRVAAIKDRVSTTGQVWMGLTFGCAQCHTHKFDPISQRDYYSLFAIFNQSEDADREDEEPKLALPTREQSEKRARLGGELSALEAQLQESTTGFERELHEWEAQMSRAVSWTPFQPTKLHALHSILSAAPDGSIAASGTLPESDTFTLSAAAPLGSITALRVEALADKALPAGGPGRSEGGNAVLSELQVHLVPKEPHVSKGRFVRVELPGNKTILSLAEVQVSSGGVNVAPKGKASQSSTDFSGEASRAIDSNTEGDYFKANSVTHTREEKNPWWEVDLGEEMTIDEIALWNRTDGGTGTRFKNFKISVLDGKRTTLWEETAAQAPAPSASFVPSSIRRLALRNASADFSQPDFEVGSALEAGSKKGWAFAGQTGRSHAAIFEFKETLKAREGDSLLVTLRQDYGTRHTLGKLRLSTTTAALPVRELPAGIRETLALEPSERSPEQRRALTAYFLPLSRYAAGIQKVIDAKKAELAKVLPVAVPIMRERAADQRRQSFILNKGNFLLRGDEVHAALPSGFVKENAAPDTNRLTLARWLMSAENPLTARVAVNRFWAQLFGTGLVETEEDFGTQGQLPSHPELLDWLAVNFMQSGWDMKATLKTIVTSATYRQSSAVSPASLQKDPRNRLLSHFSRRRLDAEGVRDQALQLAGLLSAKIGGPSVYPPQPDGLWRVAFNGGQNGYPTSTGADRYRRGLYTFLRRTMPNPSMAAFDAPSRETCVIRRVPTNTPLQAFVTLNDPMFVECAQGLARRILKEGGADTLSRLRFGLELCLGRPAQPTQIATLQRLLENARADFKTDPEGAMNFATLPLGKLPEGLDAVEAAAWTSVANVLLNLDAVLTKG